MRRWSGCCKVFFPGVSWQISHPAQILGKKKKKSELKMNLSRTETVFSIRKHVRSFFEAWTHRPTDQRNKEEKNSKDERERLHLASGCLNILLERERQLLREIGKTKIRLLSNQGLFVLLFSGVYIKALVWRCDLHVLVVLWPSMSRTTQWI